jgi:hypothetical protein
LNILIKKVVDFLFTNLYIWQNLIKKTIEYEEGNKYELEWWNGI